MTGIGLDYTQPIVIISSAARLSRRRQGFEPLGERQNNRTDMTGKVGTLTTSPVFRFCRNSGPPKGPFAWRTPSPGFIFGPISLHLPDRISSGRSLFTRSSSLMETYRLLTSFFLSPGRISEPSTERLIKHLINVGAHVAYHGRRWYVDVVSAFPPIRDRQNLCRCAATFWLRVDRQD